MRRTRVGLGALLASVVVVTACAGDEAAQRDDAPIEESATPAPVAATLNVDGRPVSVDDSLEVDPEVDALLAPYREEVNARANRVIGQLSGPLERSARGALGGTMGNFVTDAMFTSMSRVGDVDLCFTNSGGLRVDLPAGEVKEGHVVELMPFENTVVIFDVDGARLRELVSHVARRGDPASKELRYVRAGPDVVEVTVGGAPIDDDKHYKVCTNDYLFEGGGGYGIEEIAAVTYTGVLLRDCLIEAFERAAATGAAVDPVVDGRARDRGDAAETNP